MEPIDDKIYHRQEALHLAVQHGQHRPGLTDADVMRVAERFLIWLYKESN